VPNTNFTYSSFLGGEWSKFAQGRIELPSYKTAMNVCRNGVPMEEGAWGLSTGLDYPPGSYADTDTNADTDTKWDDRHLERGQRQLE